MIDEVRLSEIVTLSHGPYTGDLAPMERASNRDEEFFIRRTSVDPSRHQTFRFRVTRIGDNLVSLDLSHVVSPNLKHTIMCLFAEHLIFGERKDHGLIQVVTAHNQKSLKSFSLLHTNFFPMGITVGGDCVALRSLKETYFNQDWLLSVVEGLEVDATVRQSEEAAKAASRVSCAASSAKRSP